MINKKFMINLCVVLSLPLLFVFGVYFFIPKFFIYLFYASFVFDAFELIIILLMIKGPGSCSGYDAYAIGPGYLIASAIIILLLFCGGFLSYLHYRICASEIVFTIAIIKFSLALILPSGGILYLYLTEGR